MSQVCLNRPKLTLSMRVFGPRKSVYAFWPTTDAHIYISREISIEHPSVGLTSLAQLFLGWNFFWLVIYFNFFVNLIFLYCCFVLFSYSLIFVSLFSLSIFFCYVCHTCVVKGDEGLCHPLPVPLQPGFPAPPGEPRLPGPALLPARAHNGQRAQKQEV